MLEHQKCSRKLVEGPGHLVESLEGLVRLVEVHKPHGQDSKWLCKTD